MSAATSLPPQGDPDAILCRHCHSVRIVVHQTLTETFRACRLCDSPGHIAASWDRA